MKCPKCGKHYEQDGKWCWDCGDELEPEPARRAEKDSRSSSWYANGEKLRAEISAAINRCSAENGSNTPDFILAEYLTNCLAAFDAATARREKWYGYTLSIPYKGPRADEGDSHTE